jgi:ABC-type branched-subunit amino acid transport system permease subunit
LNPRTQRIVGFVAFAAFVAFVAVLPSFVSDFKAREYSYVAIYLIALLGLNILTGYTGQISLGHGAFMAIGGYTTAILMAGNEQFGGPIPGGMKDLWTIPLAGLVAGLVGLAFGLPALRLSGLYLALATFAIAVAMPSTVKRFEEWTGGGQGIQLFGLPERTGSNATVGDDPNAPATFDFIGITFTQNDWMYCVAWSIALVAFAVAWLILRGRTGRAFRAVRDSETAAVSSGVSLARYKTLAFGISAAYAGVAGGPRGRRRRWARGVVRARLRRDLRLLPAALVAGRGSRVAAAEPNHRGDSEARRPVDRLRRRSHPLDVHPAERRRRAVPPDRAALRESALLSFRVTRHFALGG